MAEREQDPGLHEAAAALRAGQITAEALNAQTIARRDPDLQAYIEWRPEAALKRARLVDGLLADAVDLGPLMGLPVSVKDIFGLSGWPTRAGGPRELPPAWHRDGPLVARLRRQMAVVPGKTHSVQFAFGGLGTNPHWPSPRNPWDRERVAGGSSSGAGVSLAEGTALLAFGTDTAGSVRIPASVTGAAGLKTTAGRWPLEGIVPLSPTLDTPGLLARSVADLAFAFAALDRPEASWQAATPPRRDLAGLRLGLPEDFFWSDCSPGIAEGVERALGELERAGARLRRVALPGAAEVYELFRAGGLAAPELHAFLTQELPDWFPLLDPNVAQRMEAVSELPASVYLARRQVFAAQARRAAAVFDEVDLLAAPTVAITPPTFAELAVPETARSRNLQILRNTAPASCLGFCALTLPVALDAAGLPVGLQLMAPGFAEESLLELGCRIELQLGQARQRLGRPASA